MTTVLVVTGALVVLVAALRARGIRPAACQAGRIDAHEEGGSRG